MSTIHASSCHLWPPTRLALLEMSEIILKGNNNAVGIHLMLHRVSKRFYSSDDANSSDQQGLFLCVLGLQRFKTPQAMMQRLRRPQQAHNVETASHPNCATLFTLRQRWCGIAKKVLLARLWPWFLLKIKTPIGPKARMARRYSLTVFRSGIWKKKHNPLLSFSAFCRNNSCIGSGTHQQACELRYKVVKWPQSRCSNHTGTSQLHAQFVISCAKDMADESRHYPLPWILNTSNDSNHGSPA